MSETDSQDLVDPVSDLTQSQMSKRRKVRSLSADQEKNYLDPVESLSSLSAKTKFGGFPPYEKYKPTTDPLQQQYMLNYDEKLRKFLPQDTFFDEPDLLAKPVVSALQVTKEINEQKVFMRRVRRYQEHKLRYFTAQYRDIQKVIADNIGAMKNTYNIDKFLEEEAEKEM